MLESIETYIEGLNLGPLPTAGIILLASLVAAQLLSGVGMVLVYGIVLGATTGLMVTVHGVVWATYFGRKHLGSIAGITTTILIVASSLGPMPLAIAHDLLGSYNPVLTASVIPPLLLSVASPFFAKPPKKMQP